jgi:hypothetical protein
MSNLIEDFARRLPLGCSLMIWAFLFAMLGAIVLASWKLLELIGIL